MAWHGFGACAQVLHALLCKPPCLHVFTKQRQHHTHTHVHVLCMHKRESASCIHTCMWYVCMHACGICVYARGMHKERAHHVCTCTMFGMLWTAD